MFIIKLLVAWSKSWGFGHKNWVIFHLPNMSYPGHSLQVYANDQVLAIVVMGLPQVDLFLDGRIALALPIMFLGCLHLLDVYGFFS